MHEPGEPSGPSRASDRLALAGVFLLVLGVYVLTSSGRIDTIDAQFRFSVAESWYRTGVPEVADPILHRGTFAGIDGRRFSAYNAPPSLFGIPFLALADRLGARNDDARRFAFMLVSPLFGAALASLTCWTFLGLGVPRRRAVGWAIAAAFCTLVWPVAASGFDQVQHAFFLLLALALAHRSAVRERLALALAGGCAAGVAIAYQESYALLAPLVGLACFPDRRPRLRPGLPRYLLFGLGSAAGLGLWAAYNLFRTGHLVVENRFGFGRLHPPMWGNPLDGAASLLVSPGRGVLFFSPLVVLAVAGVLGLRRSRPALALAVVSASLLHFGFISTLSFFSGEWCWGPRYLVVALVLFHLGLPFAPPLRPIVRRGLVAAGCGVQLLGLSLETSRFHYEHRHPIYFWRNQPGLYFRESQLASRPLEILDTIFVDRPPASLFRPGPYPDQIAWAIQGVGDRSRPESWMPFFRVFYLPRPWPLWMHALPPEARYVPVWRLTALFSAIAAAGLALLVRSRRERSVPAAPASAG